MNEQVFVPFPVLSTDRLTLRRLIEADLPTLIEITAFTAKQPSLEHAKEVFYKTEKDYEDRTALNWGMEYNGELIGTCGYYRGFENNIGEVGYMLRAVFRSKGFMQETLEKVLSFGFSQLELDQITAYTKDDNIPSIQLLKKFGFMATDVFSGTNRKYLKYRLST